MSLTQSICGNTLGLQSATAGTAYYAVIPPYAPPNAAGVPTWTPSYVTRICQLQYTCGNTANGFYVMRPIGRTTVAAAATTSVAAVTLAADPSPSGNTIAAGDQVVMQYADGTFRRTQVNTSGWDSTNLILTFTGNLPANVAAGAQMWMFGVNTDTDPTTGSAFPVIPTTVNTNNTAVVFGPSGMGGVQKGDPLLVYNPNATAATNLNFLEYANAYN